MIFSGLAEAWWFLGAPAHDTKGHDEAANAPTDQS
jgi:hypothetical protein